MIQVGLGYEQLAGLNAAITRYGESCNAEAIFNYQKVARSVKNDSAGCGQTACDFDRSPTACDLRRVMWRGYPGTGCWNSSAGSLTLDCLCLVPAEVMAKTGLASADQRSNAENQFE